MPSEKDGVMIILSSPSGAGKTTLVKMLSEQDNFETSISHTTRKPRPSETQNKDYFFVNEDNFKRLIKNEEFLEYAKVFNNFYGTTRTPVIDKLNKGKNVLLVDDSIVRGTTSSQIIEMARESGAKKVYFASAAPEIRFPNVYGIDMPSANELVAYGREIEQISDLIQADGLIFQDLDDLVVAVQEENQGISRFETSVFDGDYITGDVDQGYLESVDAARNEDAKKAPVVQAELSNLDVHNLDSN